VENELSHAQVPLTEYSTLIHNTFSVLISRSVSRTGSIGASCLCEHMLHIWTYRGVCAGRLDSKDFSTARLATVRRSAMPRTNRTRTCSGLWRPLEKLSPLPVSLLLYRVEPHSGGVMSKFIPAHTKHSTSEFLVMASLSVVLLMVFGGIIPTATNFNRGVGPHPSIEIGNVSAVNSSVNSSNAAPAAGPQVVSVTVLTPVGSNGQSLVEVALNGTAHANGSVLPDMIAGYDYTFSAVDINANYSFDQWYVNYGTIVTNSSPTSPIIPSCYIQSGSCAPVYLTGTLFASSYHNLMSGYIDQAKYVSEVNATFKIPTSDTLWTIQNHPAPNGTREIVNWGIGIGGITTGSKVLVVGVFLSTYQAFWATSMTGILPSVQTNFTKTPLPGDIVTVGITGRPGSVWAISISDLNSHNSWNQNNLYSGSVGTTTGEWGTWDPLASSKVLALNYSFGTGKGRFSNLTFNGAVVHVPMQWSGQLSYIMFPLVSFSQWMGAGGGWNESLNPGFLFSMAFAVDSGYFDPGVLSLARLQIDTFDLDHFLGVVINGTLYYNGAAPNLQPDIIYDINLNGTNSSDQFVRWGTSAGIIGNTGRQSTTLDLTTPGNLEGLTLEKNNFWAGYLEATNSSYFSGPTGPVWEFPNSAAGEFRVPNSSFNGSPGLKTPEVASIWVGLSGYNVPLIWQAGITIQYNTSGSQAWIFPWYEWINISSNLGPVRGPRAFTIAAGNRIVVTISVSGGANCTWIHEACWTIADLDQGRYLGQTNPAPYEVWNGSISTTTYPLVGPLTGPEWIVESPWGCNGISYRCAMPQISPVNFSYVSVNGTQVYILGPYLAEEAVYNLPNSLTQYLTPSTFCGPEDPGFDVSEP